MLKCCLFQWIFSLAGRLYLWRKTFCLSKCDFCRLFHTERSWHAFSAVIVVSGRHDLPFDARAFPLTSFEMQCPSLPLIKGFRLFIFFQSASWIRIIISGFLSRPWIWQFPTMFCHAVTIAYLAFAFLITRFRFLVTVSSKGPTNEYTYKRQYNHSRHVHEL